MKFQKGQSGNPAGRPKGTKDFRNILTEALIRENQGKIKQVIDRLFEVALEEKDGFFGGEKLLQYPWLGKLLLEYFLVKPNNSSVAADEDSVSIEDATDVQLDKPKRQTLKSV